MEKQAIESMETPQAQGQAQPSDATPAPGAPVDDTPDGELDPAVATLMLMTGARLLQHIADNDRDGAVAFIDEVFGEIRRQQRLMRLLELDQNDLERLLQNLDQTPQLPTPPSEGANSPARELFSPAERVGKAQRSGKKSLREYVFGG